MGLDRPIHLPLIVCTTVPQTLTSGTTRKVRFRVVIMFPSLSAMGLKNTLVSAGRMAMTIASISVSVVEVYSYPPRPPTANSDV